MTALILDTETTGFRDPEIIQFASIELSWDAGRIDRFSSFYRPSKPIELGALATHHILDEDLSECEPWVGFEGVYTGPCHAIIGHNIDFDWRVIGAPDVPRICTLALSRWLWPKLDSHSLGAMMYFINRTQAREKLRGAHDAETDVELTYELLQHILDNLDYDLYNRPSSWHDLWILSERARIPTVMPFGKYKGQAIERVPRDYVAWLRRQSDVDPYVLKAFER